MACTFPAATSGLGPTENPSPAYPPVPRTPSGTNPLAALGKPVECSPKRDHGPPGPYFQLRKLKKRQGTNPFVKGAPFTTVLTLVNKKGQSFHIYVSAGSAFAVQRFIAATSACLEAFPLKKQVPAAVEPVQFDVLLIQAAEQATGLPQTQLAAIRDQLAATGPTSFRAVIIAANANPDVVIESAITAAATALQAKVADGELTAAEVAAIDLPTVLRDLADDPGAYFLFSPSELPLTPAQIGRNLKDNPKRNVAIGMSPVSPLPTKQSIVWYAFDPTINNGVTHSYVAQCRRHASVQISAWAGTESVRFWRTSPYYHWVGSRTATAVGLSSNMWHSSAPSYRSYDTNVRGWTNGGSYSIYGEQTWVRGGGGGC